MKNRSIARAKAAKATADDARHGAADGQGLLGRSVTADSQAGSAGASGLHCRSGLSFHV